VVNFTEDDPFDPKAVWLNAEHIRTMPVADLADRLLPVVSAPDSSGPAKMLQITPLIQERIKLLRDVLTVADFFFARVAAVRQRRADPARKAMPPWR
jgi:glutamyl-tRNA synthetase